MDSTEDSLNASTRTKPTATRATPEQIPATAHTTSQTSGTTKESQEEDVSTGTSSSQTNEDTGAQPRAQSDMEAQGEKSAGGRSCGHNSTTYSYSPRGFQEVDFESFEVETFEEGLDRLLAGATAVDFDEANVDDEKMQRVIQSLEAEGCKCRWLTLYDVHMEPTTVDTFAETLRKSTTLKAVNLSGYPLPLDILRGIDPELDLTADDDEQLALYMEADGKGLDLRMEKYGWMECAIMAILLHGNEQLEELILSESKLDTRCIQELTRGLLHNRALRILTLARNEIGSDGAILLAEYLKENKVLLELDVDDNGIDDRGASALGDMLRTNTTLLSLKIRKNNFNVAILTEALKANQHMIDFACDGITQEMLTEFGFVTNNDAVVVDVNNPQSLLG